MNKLLASALIGAALLGLAACEVDENTDQILVSLSVRDNFGQEVSSFSSGETVTLVLRVENDSDRAASIDFDDGQIFDFEISNSSGAQVWLWSDGMAFTTAAQSTQFAAGEVRNFSVDWEQVDNDGNDVPLGSYSVQAELTANNLDSDQRFTEVDNFTLQ